MNIPTICSFYTEDEYYSPYATKFIDKLKLLNSKSKIQFPSDIIAHNKSPDDTWSSVCFEKPKYIRKWLDKYDRIIWIDIDSDLIRLPVRKADKILSADFDLGGISRGNKDGIYDYLWYIKSTDRTKKFFDDIISLIDKKYRNHHLNVVKEGGDHDAVLNVFKEYKKCPNFYRSLGGGNFGRKTGWATFGISGFETQINSNDKIAESAISEVEIEVEVEVEAFEICWYKSEYVIKGVKTVFNGLYTSSDNKILIEYNRGNSRKILFDVVIEQHQKITAGLLSSLYAGVANEIKQQFIKSGN